MRMIQCLAAGMNPFINQHSFTLLGAMALLTLSVVLLRDGPKPSDFLAIGSLAAGLVLAYLLLNPGASTERDADRVRAQIGAGVPVLLEFQSPY